MQGRAVFLDASPKGGGWGQSLAFGVPEALRRTETLATVPEVVAWAEAQAAAGRWVVLMLAYEAAPAFDPALMAHVPVQGLPLAWAASHAAPLPTLPAACASPGPAVPEAAPWRPLVPQADYTARLAELREHIANGDTYQANYTFPFERVFHGDDLVWFAELARAQAAGFCAWLDLGRHRVLSLSPELFFRQRGREILARPMKGTAKRGATPEADAAARQVLALCPKNRAENVMIVDLLRNDLGRLAVPGGVDVPVLFRIEQYPTIFQMTSDVRARLRLGVGLPETLAALFPCGSVTGAPKISTMRIIREMEPHPRGVYCGAIGLLEPGHGAAARWTFSVPIRTIDVDIQTGLARFGVGGGITYDSTASGEYAECLAKMRFLIPPAEEFELLESLLLRDGAYPRLDRHLERLEASAAQFGFALRRQDARQALAHLALDHPQGRFKARLVVSREGSTRAEAVALASSRAPLHVGWAAEPVSSADLMLAHKTTRREMYERALASCLCPQGERCDDALLQNERGEVTESTRANLVLLLDGKLVTPPLSCGLLPGVFRARLVERGVVAENVLTPKEVLRASRVWLVNSVRGWMPCRVLPRPEG